MQWELTWQISLFTGKPETKEEQSNCQQSHNNPRNNATNIYIIYNKEKHQNKVKQDIC